MTDLPGIYSLSPYTLEEVVARNYLIGERPDAILNMIDGTNLERNLYLTTQLTELGIPVVVAVNMMDIVRKNGDKINFAELSRQLGCKVVEISALKGEGVMEAAEAAIRRRQERARPCPMHSFAGPVEHAIAHIEEAELHAMPEEQPALVRHQDLRARRKGDRAAEDRHAETMKHIDDGHSRPSRRRWTTTRRASSPTSATSISPRSSRAATRRRTRAGLTVSDKIDRVVTNRWLGLPIFARGHVPGVLHRHGYRGRVGDRLG